MFTVPLLQIAPASRPVSAATSGVMIKAAQGQETVDGRGDKQGGRAQAKQTGAGRILRGRQLQSMEACQVVSRKNY